VATIRRVPFGALVCIIYISTILLYAYMKLIKIRILSYFIQIAVVTKRRSYIYTPSYTVSHTVYVRVTVHHHMMDITYIMRHHMSCVYEKYGITYRIQHRRIRHHMSYTQHSTRKTVGGQVGRQNGFWPKAKNSFVGKTLKRLRSPQRFHGSV
jgi:hypothetical protein